VESGGAGAGGRDVEVETAFDAGDLALEFGRKVHLAWQ
jgi:hypothetical protein